MEILAKQRIPQQQDKDNPQNVQIQLVHYKQRYNWDCGISCVLMVLNRTSRADFIKNFTQICRNEGFNKSTWTIDLCYLLKRFDVKFTFHTITFGVCPGYVGNTFYNHIFKKDESRINGRFAEALETGMRIKQTSLACQDFLNHLSNGPIIVLTNARLLICDVCKLNKISNELKKCLPWPTTTYQGHYVVLVGYDLGRQKVFYRNPALNDHVCVMPFAVLEAARRAFGTDEDAIFIFK